MANGVPGKIFPESSYSADGLLDQANANHKIVNGRYHLFRRVADFCAFRIHRFQPSAVCYILKAKRTMDVSRRIGSALLLAQLGLRKVEKARHGYL